MSTPPAGEHVNPVQRVISELRALSTVQDRLDQYAAARFGVNRTDLRALDLIGQAGATSPTALAAALGMSTGATSTVLDRLEAAGYVRREPDPHHRRRTVVRMTPAAEALSAGIFDPVIGATAERAGALPAHLLADVAAFLAAHRQALADYLDGQAATTTAEGDADPGAGR
ncbi:MarR family transcriptional regulator [Pseudonocardia sp. K10HN5]|uniref:MarR family transcriptional regulator n=1 Tax=Pseudonocardia acidicola TaxID=2724939 RepID=A0ABX1S7H7_9PSEU|nr:MarR family transcriptional regulator [Pseudonocardia acidicola]